MRVGYLGLALREYRRLQVSHKLITQVVSRGMLVLCFSCQFQVPVIFTGVVMGGEKLSPITYLICTATIALAVPYICLFLTMASKPIEVSRGILSSWQANGLRTLENIIKSCI